MCLFFIFKRQKKFATHPSLAMSYGQPIGVKCFAVVRKITIFLEYHVVSFDKPFAPRSIYYLFQFIQQSHVNNSTSGLECVKIQIIFATDAASETFFCKFTAASGCNESNGSADAKSFCMRDSREYARNRIMELQR